MTARGVIVAAPRSGAGKTTVTLGLLAALKRRGVAVRAAKAGPDYIDPAFHAAATGVRGFNLDTWAMPASLLDWLLAETARRLRAAGHRRRHGVVRRRARSRAAAPARRPTSPRDLACRCCSCSTCRRRRSPRPRWCAGFCFARSRSPYRRRRAQPRRQRAPSPAGGRCDLGARHTCHGRAAARRHLCLPERHLGLVQAERA